MTSSITANAAPGLSAPGVSTPRLWVLRATYLLMVLGLGLSALPGLFAHEAQARGVIPSVLAGIWLLALLGLFQPLKLLPLLLFELAWKLVWFLAYGLPQWLSGQQPATFGEDFPAILFGVILMPLVIPWGYVYRQYFRAARE